MRLTDYLIIAVTVVSITLLALGWRAEYGRRLLATATADRTRDSLALVVAAQDSAAAVYEAAHRAWTADTVRRTRQLARARADLDRLRRVGDSLAGAIDTSAPPVDQMAQLRQVAAIRLQEARTCGMALDTTLGLYRACTGRLGAVDTLLARERQVRVATEALAAQYRRLSHPSIWTRVTRGLPWLAVGVVAGLVLTQ